jgi:hypothetical protein
MYIFIHDGMVGYITMGVGNRLHGIKGNKHGSIVYWTRTSVARELLSSRFRLGKTIKNKR